MKKKFSKLIGASLLCLSIVLPNASFAFDVSQLPELKSDVFASAHMYKGAMALTDKTASVQRKQAAARGELEQAIDGLANILRKGTGLKEEGGEIKWDDAFFIAKIARYDTQLQKINAVLTGPLNSDSEVVDLLSAVAAKAQGLKNYWSTIQGSISKSPNVTVVGRVDPQDWGVFAHIRDIFMQGLIAFGGKAPQFNLEPADGIKTMSEEDLGFFSSKTLAAHIFRRSLDPTVDASALAQEVTVMLRAELKSKLAEAENKLVATSAKLASVDSYVAGVKTAMLQQLFSTMERDDTDINYRHIQFEAWSTVEEFYRTVLSVAPVENREELITQRWASISRDMEDLRENLISVRRHRLSVVEQREERMQSIQKEFSARKTSTLESLEMVLKERRDDLRAFLGLNHEQRAKELDAIAASIPIGGKGDASLEKKRVEAANEAGRIKAEFSGLKKIYEEGVREVENAIERELSSLRAQEEEELRHLISMKEEEIRESYDRERSIKLEMKQYEIIRGYMETYIHRFLAGDFSM